MSAKVTPWFPVGTNPVHVGAYEVENLPYPFHYWNGTHWLNIAEAKPSKFKRQDIDGAEPIYPKSYITKRRWRGLAKKP